MGLFCCFFQQSWKRPRRPNFKGKKQNTKKEGLQKYKKGKYKAAIGFGPLDDALRKSRGGGEGLT